MSIRFVCGAECGINVIGSFNGTSATIGSAHWNTIGNTGAAPVVDTSVFRSGGSSYKFPPHPASNCFLTASVASSQTVHYFRGYFRVDDATPSMDTFLNKVTHSGDGAGLQVTTAGILRMQMNTAGVTQDYSGTLVANEWYGVEMQVDVRQNPMTVDWRIWRQSTGWVNQTQLVWAATVLSAAQHCRLGAQEPGDLNLWWDDVVWGAGTAIDEDWSDSTPKSGEVKIIRPTSDGTHSFSTSGNFKYENVTNFAQTATDVWSHLDAPDMTQTAEFISQNTATGGTTKYCEVLFPDESVLTDVHGVMPLGAFRASATQACEMNARFSDDGTNWTNLIGNWGTTGRDVSETNNMYLRPDGATPPPSGGSWTRDKVNGLRFQFGMSDDVSPVPFVGGLAFEVAWITADAPTFSGTVSASHSSATSASGTKSVSSTASASHVSSATPSGTKAVSGAISVSHSSAATAAGEVTEAFDGTASASHSSSVTVSGTKGVSGSVSASHSNSASATGAGARSGAGTSSNTSATSASGAPSLSGAATSSNTQSTSAAGSKSSSGVVSLPHTAQSTSSGNKAVSGNVTASHSSSTSAVGTKEEIEAFEGEVDVSHSSSTSASGFKAVSVDIAVSHADSATAVGTHTGSGTASASHSSSTTTVGSKSASGVITDSKASATSATGTKNISASISDTRASSVAAVTTSARSSSISDSRASSVVATGIKAVSGDVSASATTAVVIQGGQHASSSAIVDSKVNSTTANGSKAVSGAASVSHSSATTASGTAAEASAGEFQVIHLEDASAAGSKSTQSTISATSASSTSASGFRSVSGTITVSAASSALASGTGSKSGQVAVIHSVTVPISGFKSTSGSIAGSSASSVTAGGAKSSGATVSLSNQSSTATVGAHFGSSAITDSKVSGTQTSGIHATSGVVQVPVTVFIFIEGGDTSATAAGGTAVLTYGFPSAVVVSTGRMSTISKQGSHTTSLVSAGGYYAEVIE